LARIMGIDAGTRFIGIAVSDETQTIASGKETIDLKKSKDAFEIIKGLVLRYGIEEIVVGLPLNMNATIGPSANYALRFAEELKTRLNVPVRTFDERLTTKQGESLMLSADMSRKKRRQKIDRLAAQILLQAYLDMKKS